MVLLWYYGTSVSVVYSVVLGVVVVDHHNPTVWNLHLPFDSQTFLVVCSNVMLSVGVVVFSRDAMRLAV